MFAKTIIDSDAFLDMPLSSQCLYFHLSMRADDEGFINNPRKIQRMIGGSEDDFKLLIAKKFVIPFESGVCVIKHWRIHNYIQSDRFKETMYLEEKSMLEVKNNKAYTLNINEENIPCIQDVYNADTQVRLGKDSIGKDSIGKDNYIAERFTEFWQAYPKKKSKGDAEKAFKKIKPTQELQDKIMFAISKAKQSKDWLKDNGQYIPYPATWLNAKCWEDELETEVNTYDEQFEIGRQAKELIMNGF